ncbi:MAG: FeoC-like transcriptional regulator [Candidatus Cloacimonetes bacterium]|nr:FeoC-like transcriptional regulator [Candidatus Cloacimonadota bacterium]
MLLELRNYVRQNKQVTLEDLIIHFESSYSAIEPLLSQLEDRNIIEIINLTCTGCNSNCSSCSDFTKRTIIRYIDSKIVNDKN